MMVRLESGDVVVMGGHACNEDADILTSVERYTPDSDAWTDLAALPSARERSAVVALDDGLLVVGGVTNDEPNLDVVRYDAELDSWLVVSTLPFEASHPLVTRLDDVAIVAADALLSVDGDTWHRSVDDGESWEKISDGPDILGGSTYSRSLVAMSGVWAFFNQTWGAPSIYDAGTNTWTLPAPQYGLSIGAAAALDGATVLTMRASPTAEQASSGTLQYEPVGVVFGPEGDLVITGFSNCPVITGQLEQYEAAAWGAASGTVVVKASRHRLSTYNGDAGWATLPRDPSSTTGWAATAEHDGSLLVTGGCGDESGRAVRRWSP